MTETQESILSRLHDGDMRVTELAEDLHMVPCVLRKIMNQMEKNKWIKKEGSYYTLVLDYAPSLEWSFKELLKVWK